MKITRKPMEIEFTEEEKTMALHFAECFAGLADSMVGDCQVTGETFKYCDDPYLPLDQRFFETMRIVMDAIYRINTPEENMYIDYDYNDVDV